MEPAGVRGGLDAGIGDFDRHRERLGSEPVFDREREGERIDRARARIVDEGQPGEVGCRGFDSEGLEAGEAVQPERIGVALNPRLAVPRPPDDRIEDRTDVGPDRRIARPHQIPPGNPPLYGFAAEKRDRGLRVAAGERDFGHQTIPSKAAAAMSACLIPGAQAMSALPLARPSPFRKSLT